MSDEPPQPPVERLPSGTEVRDHLANERTYLAWMRTAIALLGLGFVVARLRLEFGGVVNSPGSHGPTHLVGLSLSSLGILAILFATYRYQQVRRMINEGQFTSLGSAILLISGASLLVAVGVVAYLITALIK